ncbi:MAG TPA: hypothetical protein PLZ84_00350, partial [Clostridia bacterium]|nr:hypothetical protein [Clostridia bacterium]
RDLTRIKKQQRRIIVISAVFTFFMLALFAYFTYVRRLLPAYFSLIIWTFTLITVWAIKFRAILKYGSLLEDALSGKGLESRGEFAGVGETTEIDGHMFVELFFSEKNQKQKYKRKIYYDADLTMPELVLGAEFKYRTLQNYCISLERVD